MVKIAMVVGILLSSMIANAAGQASASNAAQAHTNTPCIIEGSYQLQTNSNNGSMDASSIQGYVGNESVYWNIFGGIVQAYIGGRNYNLYYSNSGGYETIDGYISSTYVRWSGSSGFISGYQNCVR